MNNFNILGYLLFQGTNIELSHYRFANSNSNITEIRTFYQDLGATYNLFIEEVQTFPNGTKVRVMTAY
jgi:hypothetical protein